jgi:WD40-like Beta Propeller Repeat
VEAVPAWSTAAGTSSRIGLFGMIAMALVAAPFAFAVGGGPSAAARGTKARAGGYWILLESNRDGVARGYSVRPDGSRLTPLLPGALEPVAVSHDGGLIAYRDTRFAIYASRANGTGLRRLVRETAFDAALSQDGRLLAFVTSGKRDTISIVGTDGRGRHRLTSGPEDRAPDWSPDGKALVFRHDVSDEREEIVVQPLRGRRRVLARGDAPQWSPDGRWIAYTGRDGLYVTRPNGAQQHRVARGDGAFAWSPDSRRLALARSGDVVVVAVDGRGLTRVLLRHLGTWALSWSPDGHRLILAAPVQGVSQIWLVGIDGRELRRLTGAGSNRLIGWTRLAPVLPPARPVPPTERVTGSRAVMVRAPIADLAADGRRVAFITGTTRTDCHHVAVWTPATKSVRRFAVPAPCLEVSPRDGMPAVALAGTRVAWLQTGGGNTLETALVTATLSRPAPVWIAEGAADDNDVGTFARKPVGDEALLAFTIERSCDSDSRADPDTACPAGRKTGEIVAATAYRIGGSGPCPLERTAGRQACTLLAKADGTMSVLAIDAGRIAVKTEAGVTLLTAAGDVLRNFAVNPTAAALSGKYLAVRTPNAVELFDSNSGMLSSRFPAPNSLRLEDLEGDILVTASGATVTVRRLSDGRTSTIQAGGTARAQLESPGLFIAGAGRLTFTPMHDVLRQLGD